VLRERGSSRTAGCAAENHAHAEDRAIAIGPSVPRCPIEKPVAGLQEPPKGSGAVRAIEAVQRGQRACGSYLEYRAAVVGSGQVGCPVEVAVAALDQPGVRVGTIHAAWLRAKAVQRGQHARGVNSEDRATAIVGAITVEVAPVYGCPVEVPVAGLRQHGERLGAIRAEMSLFRAKHVDRGQRACGGDFEDRAAAVTVAPAVSPVGGCPVEVAVTALHQPSRLVAVSTVQLRAKAVQRGHRTAGGEFEDRATPVYDLTSAVTTVTTAVGCPIEVAVAALHQRAQRPHAVSAGEAVHHGQRTCGGDFEDGAVVAVEPARPGCPVEVPVVALHQPSVRPVAVLAVRLRAKAIHCGQHARSGDFEDRATADTPTGSVGPATGGRPIETPVVALNERNVHGVSAVGPIEIYKSVEEDALCGRGNHPCGSTKQEKHAYHRRPVRFLDATPFPALRRRVGQASMSP